jgi:A/G-specific adenine glycosylase
VSGEKIAGRVDGRSAGKSAGQTVAESDAAESFAGRLMAWQLTHGRHGLPWQGTRDAYRVWLSEIMLQQTQVGTVMPYYARFLERYPNVAELAAARVETVLELWAGLGYYARARNLHRCAQAVVAEHGGCFPELPSALAELPGIGRSTAAAIAAFAFGARAAILDGNVKRVLARCFGIEGFPGAGKAEAEMWALAESLLPEEGIETYTQGIMDLGAILCTRSKPRCNACPMHAICVARRDGRQEALPAAKAKKVVPERETTMLLLCDGQRVLLERRPPTGIWGGLLSPPEVDAKANEVADEEAYENAIERYVRRCGGRLLHVQALPTLKHSFSHFRLTIRPLCCAIDVTAHLAAEPGWEWLNLNDLKTAALPAPVLQLLLRLAPLQAAPVLDLQNPCPESQ